MPYKRRFSEEQIVEILTSTESCRALANKFGVYHQPIVNIRRGVSYGDVRPDIPRTYVPRKRRSSEEVAAERKAKGLPLLKPKKKKAEKLPDRSCTSCVHVTWRITQFSERKIDCTLDFPEARRYGGRFARWCVCYTEGK